MGHRTFRIGLEARLTKPNIYKGTQCLYSVHDWLYYVHIQCHVDYVYAFVLMYTNVHALFLYQCTCKRYSMLSIDQDNIFQQSKASCSQQYNVHVHTRQCHNAGLHDHSELLYKRSTAVLDRHAVYTQCNTVYIAGKFGGLPRIRNINLAVRYGIAIRIYMR